MTLNEVSPPGFGHTKSDKEKGVKKGGTAAAFDKARKEGRFKGSKSDMFAIMWSQKNKGDKPHYKPGTKKKYKKYQDEAFGFEIDKGEHKKASKKAKMRNLAKGNTNPNEKAAAEKKAGGPKLYGEAKKLKTNNIPKKEMKNINYRYKNLHKQDLTGTVGEGVGRAAIGAGVGAMVGGPVGAAAGAAIGASLGKKKKVTTGAGGKKKPTNFFKAEPKVTRSEEMTYQEAIDAGWEMTADGFWWPPQPEPVTEKISFPTFKKKVAERKPQKAMDAGAKARRKLKRKEHAKYVSGSEDNVPDDIRD